MSTKGETTIEQTYEIEKDINAHCQVAASILIGHQVQNNEGQWIGRIHNIMVNLHSGRIEYLILEFGTFFGLSKKLFAIPFSEFSIIGNTNLFLINRSKEYLKAAPGFDRSHWPKTNLHSYFQDVDLFYNTPVSVA